MNDAPASMTFDARLDRLAELAVRVGLNLAPGQELLMTGLVEIARPVAAHHRAGLQGRRVAGDDAAVG